MVIAEAVRDRIAQSPATDEQIVAVVTGTGLDAAGVLRTAARSARSQGYGKSKDGLWRLDEQDPELSAAHSSHLPGYEGALLG